MSEERYAYFHNLTLRCQFPSPSNADHASHCVSSGDSHGVIQLTADCHLNERNTVMTAKRAPHLTRKEMDMNEDVILRTSPRLVRGMTTQNLPYFYVPDTQGTVVVANAHIASLVDVVADACTLGELSARTGQSATELEPVVAFLLARGILTSSVHERTPPPRPTRAHVWFHITNACNLGCLLCFVPKDLTSMRPEFAASLAERICRDAFAHGYEGVNLRVSGGEPLIAFDAIRAVVAHIEMLAERDPRFSSVTLSVLTNATLITAGHARYFAAKRIPVGVGIDGIGEINDRTRVSASGRGSYAQALEGIHSLANEGILPLVTCVISPSNMDGLEEFITTVAGC